jgi:hypothetical protein
MTTSSASLNSTYVTDATLQELLRLWQSETDSEKKERIKQAIVVIVEMHERSSFLARFILRDFDTWSQVLTKEESAVREAHKAEFYEPHFIEVLKKNDGKLDPINAIQQILERVIDKLTLADFAITKSKKFRYDTTMRFLADDLKKRGILSVNKEAKNKYWMLAKLAEDNQEQENLPGT